MIKDYFILATRNLRKRKLRAWLTMLGIFVSIATIFVLISVSLGLQYAVEEQFRLLGSDKFFVSPGGQFSAGPGADLPKPLTTEELRVIESVYGVRKTTSMVVGNGKIEYGKEIRFNMVLGLDLETSDLFLESGNLKAIEGRTLKKGDSKDIGVGYNYAYGNLFSKPVEIGDTFTINGENFKVRGIMSRVGNSQDDRNIFMPMDEARTLFNITNDRLDSIVVQIEQSEDLKDVASRTEKRLRSFRDVTEKNQDFSIMTPEDLLESFGTVLNIITGFLLGVAAISLLVGGVGIANTMYTSVLERTREIGVMKAVGARNSDILQIFLIEAGLLGLTGGVIGVILGIIVSKTIEFIAINQIGTTLLQAAIPIWLILLCLAFAFLSGAIFGVWPAYRATKIKPIEALRYE